DVHARSGDASRGQTRCDQIRAGERDLDHLLVVAVTRDLDTHVRSIAELCCDGFEDRRDLRPRRRDVRGEEDDFVEDERLERLRGGGGGGGGSGGGSGGGNGSGSGSGSGGRRRG